MSRFVIPADGENFRLNVLGEDEYIGLVVQSHCADLEFDILTLGRFKPILPDDGKTAVVILIVHVGKVVAVVVLNTAPQSSHGGGRTHIRFNNKDDGGSEVFLLVAIILEKGGIYERGALFEFSHIIASVVVSVDLLWEGELDRTLLVVECFEHRNVVAFSGLQSQDVSSLLVVNGRPKIR